MDYQLENLNPERFQLVCQALLAKEFPGTQCFPVAQPDGGRDATSSMLFELTSSFNVFQVKYVRKPLAIEDPHIWLANTLQGELEKVSRLIPEGAANYYLLTNVPGTAHHETGSIDRVQQLINTTLDIPGQCWWRNDINRRLDDAIDIKWAYPEVLSGPDVLRLIIENGLSEHGERRTNAIRAFVRDQFDRDKEVRFKQIELQNQLLDLFIDVPVTLRDKPLPRQRTKEIYAIHQVFAELDGGDEFATPNPVESAVGTATLLLHPLIQTNVPQIVLEGAPGQGKSTITQYLCQIHRRRVLGESLDEENIPPEHRNRPVRLPFKIDLRDLALWLSKKNPFSVDEPEVPPRDWHRSLEAFLAAQVTFFSGGVEFTVADLHAVAKLSAVLLVFDGLDEVADIDERQAVVSAIMTGVNRLAENAVSVQAVVTSRPAVFANSPGLPEAKYRYFELQAITHPLIDSYAAKWIRARNLHGREAADVKTILKNKLGQPHLRELCRNPMQLSIILSLINRFGASLPEKRTSLYDCYVELFVSRESEKSAVVREHRDLLIDIHQFLGWTLHSDAQLSKTGGRVSEERLRTLVTEYLEAELHDTEIVDALFSGVVHRVMALVSRLQGTFEFEVQPLREYFAAKHLYTTAPYAPAGKDRRGTKPDRFDALARDFYWLNVTRFYAGCYDKGEIASLIDRLEDLSQQDGYRHTSHPQSLASILLSDWVFSKYPKAMRRVVSMVLDGVGLRHIMATSDWRRRRSPTFVLPPKCGNKELVDRCFEILAGDTAPDFAHQIIDLVQANTGREDIRQRWNEFVNSGTGDARTSWLRYGLYLGVLADTKPEEIRRLLSDSPLDSKRMRILVRARKPSLYECCADRYSKAIDAVLDLQVTVPPALRPRSSSIEALSTGLDARRYSMAFSNRQPFPLKQMIGRHFAGYRHTGQEDEDVEYPGFEAATAVRELVDTASSEANKPASEWATTISPWSNIVDAGRRLYGERWCFYFLANVAAGIQSQREKCEDYSEFFDDSLPLCRRARYARLRVNNAKWWHTQLLEVSSDMAQLFGSLVLLTWAGPNVLTGLVKEIDDILRKLEKDEWSRLGWALERSLREVFFRDKAHAPIDCAKLPGRLSHRTAVCLGLRADRASVRQIYSQYLSKYSGNDRVILEHCQRIAILGALEDENVWESTLPVIEKCYKKGAVGEPLSHRLAHSRAVRIPLTVAKKILDRADRYPAELVGSAETVCRDDLIQHIEPVGKVAERERWFDE